MLSAGAAPSFFNIDADQTLWSARPTVRSGACPRSADRLEALLNRRSVRSNNVIGVTLLLHGARAGLRDTAEHGIRVHRHRSGGLVVQPKNGIGVTCRVPACELVEMRQKLLNGFDC